VGVIDVINRGPAAETKIVQSLATKRTNLLFDFRSLTLTHHTLM